MPALCGKVSKANRGGTAEWGIFKKEAIEDILNKKPNGTYKSLCEKCLKLAESNSF